MEVGEIFESMRLLFDHFSWWSIALVAGVTFIMIPINLLYRKLMATESLARLRKTVAVLTVYALALGAIALFAGVVLKVKLTAEYLVGSTIACGFCSMSLWFIIKIIIDYGWGGVKALLSKNSWKKSVKEYATKYDVPKSLVNLVLDNVDNFLAKQDSTEAEAVLAKQNELSNKIKTELTGFVEKDITEAVSSLFEIIKSKYSAK